jgi:ABC-type nitrate/sulfonate/bicarbonate transport system substrate-binding protein
MEESRRMKATIIAAGHFHTEHRIAPFLAKKLGFWKEEGLKDAWLIATGEDASTMPGLLLDTIQIGVDIRPSVVYREAVKGNVVYIVGSMMNTLRLIIVGAKGIRSIEELKGKTVGLLEHGGAVDNTFFRRVFAQHGLIFEKDVIVSLGVGASSLVGARPGLDKGEYYAAVIQERFADDARANGYPILSSLSEAFPNSFSQRVIVANYRYINQQSESLKAFLRAQIRACRFAKDKKNRPRVIKLIKSHDWEKKKYWGWDYSVGRIEDSPIFDVLPAEDGLPRSLEEGVKDEIAAGKLPQSFRLEQVTRLDFVKEAAEEVNNKYGLGGYI